MSLVRFIMLGGFLGAGKTTSISRLARSYQQQGLRVAIVTNDQATGLVDTHTLRSQGFDVGEVAGACFCCNFNELLEVASQWTDVDCPDVILAEPVGSCTDLVATVVQPLKQLFGEQFDVAPFGVILKPSHGLRILRAQARSGFSPQAAYIFKKQLEEADFIMINRVDTLGNDELDELTQRVSELAVGVPVLRVSARTGEGFEEVMQRLDQRGGFGRRVLELDYDTYAEGEAELGWLNMSFRVQADAHLKLDAMLLALVQRMQTLLAQIDAETAHVKAIGLSKGMHGVANLVSSDSEAELSMASDCETQRADIVLNARVAVDPETLESLARAAIEHVCQAMGAEATIEVAQCFRPGRPEPTYRMSAS